MSKRETPMTRWYWSQVGGTLVEEFPLTARSATSSPRWADGLILPSGPDRIANAEDVTVDGQDVIVVQTKVGRLRMTLMGQVVFSQKLMYLNYEPKQVRSVALCEQDDDVLRPMLEAYEVVVAPQNIP